MKLMFFELGVLNIVFCVGYNEPCLSRLESMSFSLAHFHLAAEPHVFDIHEEFVAGTFCHWRGFTTDVRI